MMPEMTFAVVIGAVTVFAGGAVALARWGWRHDPSLRHTICVTGLTLCCAVPAACVVNPRLKLEWLTLEVPPALAPRFAAGPDLSAPSSSEETGSVGESPVGDSETDRGESVSSRDSTSSDRGAGGDLDQTAAQDAKAAGGLTSVPWSLWAWSIYLVGIALLTIRFVNGVRIVGAARRSARPFPWSEHPKLADRLDAAFGRGIRECVRLSEATEQPIATGVGRELVLVPQTLRELLDDTALGDVLVHELSHVVRHDIRMGVLQRAATIAFWPHPFIHLLSGELTRAREEICDNHVLRDAPRERYARSLLAIAERVSSLPSPVASASFLGAAWPLRQRVADLLDHRRRTLVRTGVAARGLAFTLVAAGTVASLGVSFVPVRANVVSPSAPDEAAVAPARNPEPSMSPLSLWAPDPGAESDARLARALHTALNFSFDAEPLEQVVNFFSAVSGTEFSFDLAKDAEAKAKKRSVTFLSNGVPLRNALEMLLRNQDLTSVVRDGTVVITSPERTRPTDRRAYGTTRAFLDALRAATVDLGPLGRAEPRAIFKAVTIDSGIPVVVDEAALRRSGVVLDHQTASSGPVPLLELLEEVLPHEKLVVLPRFDVVYVTTPQAAEAMLPWDGPAELEDSEDPSTVFRTRSKK